MSAVAGHLARALIFVAVGVAVALAVVLPQRASATHTTVISYVQRGLISSVNCYHWYQFSDAHRCWHDDEPGSRKAIDYTVAGGPTAGASVYFQYRGDSQHFKIVDIPYVTNCTGVAAMIYWRYVGNPTYERGTVNYLHIDPRSGIIGDIVDSFEWLGTVSASQPGCYWEGVHLHQSADTSGSTPFYFNRYGNPDGDYYQEHTIYWPALQSDADNDSFGDNHELRMSTDPLDDCPDSSTKNDERGFNYWEPISPWPPDFNDDRNVDIFDVNMLKPAFFSSTGDPNYTPRLDISGPGGITDGVIDIFDVNGLKPFFLHSCTP